MQTIHGGDIYRNRIQIDFSVNINPLGIPEEVKDALHQAVDVCMQYPDMEAEQLKEALSRKFCLPKTYFLPGNGASELFLGILHALKPKKVILPVPSFYGYAYTAKAVGSEVVCVPLKKEEDFLPGEELVLALQEDAELLFLANPNNPTGKLMKPAYLENVLEVCKEKKIYVVLDECFIEFCEKENSIVQKLSTYRNLLIVRAFTKIYAIPGVRLGYLMCSDKELLQKIRGQLPEWNLSVFAEAAGIACLQQQEYLKKTVEYVTTERKILTEKLQNLGLQVILSDANFILFYSEKPLYKKLLQKGILIRDCKNFQGLSEGYYRVAVKSQRENEILEKAIGECIG